MKHHTERYQDILMPVKTSIRQYQRVAASNQVHPKRIRKFTHAWDVWPIHLHTSPCAAARRPGCMEIGGVHNLHTPPCETNAASHTLHAPGLYSIFSYWLVLAMDGIKCNLLRSAILLYMHAR